MSGAVDLTALAEQAQARRAAPGGTSGAPQVGTGGPAVVDVTEASFETDVIVRSSRQLVVVVLGTPRSPESIELTDLLSVMAERDGGRWALARVDVDVSPGIAQAFGATAVPMVAAVAGGQPVSAFNGAQPEEQIAAWLDDILAKVGGAFGDAAPVPADEPVDPAMAAAEELMNAGDLDGALAAYRAIVAADPNHAEAASTVRNLEFILRARGHDPSIVDNAAPADVDAQLAAADVLLLSQQPEAAFERVLAVVRSTAGDDKERARTRLIELFELFEPSDPMVVAARRKLAAALY